MAIAEPCCPDSMTKFLLDVFYDTSTSSMFYTTDMMVLIDIVSRQLTDLCQGDEVGGREREREKREREREREKGGGGGGGWERGGEGAGLLAKNFLEPASLVEELDMVCAGVHMLYPIPWQVRTHNLELLHRIVGSTPYSEHKHRQSALTACLNRIAHEEGSEGTKDLELVKKIWSSYPGLFEEVTDL